MVVLGTTNYANNGAATLSTALGTTYANAYCYVPAASISAGNSAEWVFCQFSSATAVTFFNNTYTSGTPAIPASPVAFVATGQGSVAGVSTLVEAYNISIPGNLLGLNGAIQTQIAGSITGTTATKTFSEAYGSATFYSSTVSASSTVSLAAQAGAGGFRNRGQTGKQVSLVTSLGTASNSYLSVDTTANQTLEFDITNATPATNNMVLEQATVELLPGVT